MSVLIKGMKMPENGNETIIRIQPNGTILDQYGHHLIIKAVYVADVVEVVRCRDCVYWRGENDICKGIGIDFNVDGYCSEGKRKNGGKEDV